ncbi:hypothetical protein [Fuerstiella marisgermanici]|uniref:Uncharacterized protein n=1 Tax=Fuerstiella marisgermanici TaxID=1891926 RepID=A0A1P8WDV0_9PLAN|nr:hypothetical protein [Fuerstiella marisgermanici]APZ92209.1 hypothetical protein Fuma_01818 [Fuerstiella marisgermanici]
MRTSVNSCLFCLATMIAGTCSPTLYAQGLIFNLPQDGTGVEYEGEIAYTTVRPDLAEGKETITKARELSIKSVGRENAEWDGQVQPCRWIEIKVNTGNAGEAGIDPGPVGSRIYKVLVPESKILNASSDNNGIPNIMLPIVKGYRRSGEAQVRPISAEAIAFYPTICQLMNYPDPQVVSASETPQTKAANMSFNSQHLLGKIVIERPESRSTNEAHFWVSEEVPFGLARWEVTVTREQKESTATRDNFQEVSTTTSTMSVRKVLPVAESELIIPR